MKTIITLSLILSAYFANSQSFQSPKVICNNSQQINILKSYQDKIGNDYLFWLEPLGVDSSKIVLQKFDTNDNPLFVSCGIIVKKIRGGSDRNQDNKLGCIVDNDGNIYVFLSVYNENLNGEATYNLLGIKIDKNGTNTSSVGESPLIESAINLSIQDIEQTTNQDIHILLSSGNPIHANYLRILPNGTKKFSEIDLGNSFYLDLSNPAQNIDFRKNTAFYKNTQGELIIAIGAYDFSLAAFTIFTYKVDNEGIVTSYNIDSNMPKFVQFNEFEGNLYLIKEVNGQYSMYKFDSDSTISITPIISFTERPLGEIVKTQNHFFYIYSNNGIYFLQKIDYNGQKKLLENGYELINAQSLSGKTIQLFPNNQEGIRILYYREDGPESGLVYQLIDTNNIPQFGFGTKLFTICNTPNYVTTGNGLVDKKDNSLNVYINLGTSIEGVENYYILRQDLLIAFNENCTPYIIKKN